jgi:hypothetical protein
MPGVVEDSDADLSLVSNGSTLVDSPRTCDTSPGSLIADVSESHGKPCSQCKKTEGDSLLDGTPVIFDFKKNGKRYGRCRRCTKFIKEKQSPSTIPSTIPSAIARYVTFLFRTFTHNFREWMLPKID